MAVPGAALLVINWALQGQIWAQNVLHFPFTSAGTLDQVFADDLAAAVDAAFASTPPPAFSPLQNVISDQVILDSVTVQDIRVDDQDQFTGDIQTSGIASVDLLPLQLGIAVQLRTGPGDPNGRTFQWGYGETGNDPLGRPSVTIEEATPHFYREIHDYLGTLSGISGLGVEIGRAHV